MRIFLKSSKSLQSVLSTDCVDTCLYLLRSCGWDCVRLVVAGQAEGEDGKPDHQQDGEGGVLRRDEEEGSGGRGLRHQVEEDVEHQAEAQTNRHQVQHLHRAGLHHMDQFFWIISSDRTQI